VLAVSDHYARELAQRPSGPRRCMGLLFGQQEGRVVKVLETVECAFTEEKQGQTEVQQEAVEADMKLCKKGKGRSK
jgi:proteasome lid subunit RPN8/RPN11